MQNDFGNILIVSDVDGTFLGQHSRLVERNLKAIERFKARGGLFTFATGRMIINIKTVIPNVAEIVNIPVLMSNGTYIYDYATDTVIDESEMNYEAALRVAKFVAEKYPRVMLRLSRIKNFYTERNEGYIAKDFSRVSKEDYVVAPIEEWPKDHWLKFVFRGEPDDIDCVKDDLAEFFSDVIEINKSNERFLECQVKGCTKATELGRLIDYVKKERGIDDLTVIAAGDYENDYDMLRCADISVCPSNALDNVKSVCDYCLCDHDEGLIADIIEKIESGDIKIFKKVLDKRI